MKTRTKRAFLLGIVLITTFAVFFALPASAALNGDADQLQDRKQDRIQDADCSYDCLKDQLQTRTRLQTRDGQSAP